MSVETSLPDAGARPTRVRFVVLTWLAAAAAFAYLVRNALSIPVDNVIADLGLNEREMGLLLGPAFFWPYALSQLPAAWVSRRLGSRASLALWMSAGAVGALLIGLANGFLLLIIARVLTGIAQAGLFPASLVTVARWHPITERARASGVIGAFMSIGGAFCTWMTGQLLVVMSWRTIHLWYAVPSAVWAAGFWWWFRNTPADHRSPNDAERKLIAEGQPVSSDSEPIPKTSSRIALALALSPALWFICAQQFFRASGYIFYTTWFPTFLQKTRGISAADAGKLTALPLIATVLAAFVGGWVSDFIYRRTGNLGLARKGVAMTALFLAGFVVCSAAYVTDPTTAAFVVAIGAFIAGLAAPLSYAVTIDMGGRDTSTVFASMNMFGNIGAGLFPGVSPFLAELVQGDEDLLRLCGGSSWNAVLFLFASVYFGAAACWLMLRVRGTVLSQSLLARRIDDGGADHPR